MELIQPYIDAVVTALIGLLAALLVAGITSVRKKVEAWLEARTTDQQREALHKIAQEAYALVEAQFKGSGAERKLEEAKGYLLQRLNALGISLTDEEIRAAIEKAWLEFGNKK